MSTRDKKIRLPLHGRPILFTDRIGLLGPIDPMQKWLPFETKILKNLLSRTRLVGLF